MIITNEYLEPVEGLRVTRAVAAPRARRPSPNSMPNKRSKDKVELGAFIDARLWAELRVQAHKRGVTVTDLVLGFFLRGCELDEHRLGLAPARNTTR